MKLLPDTHVFLWSLLETAKLSADARLALAEPANEVLVSAVTFWEIAIESSLGRLELHGIRPEDLPMEARTAGYTTTALDPETAASSHALPLGDHRDPFDRLLVWQAIRAGWTLVSRDRAISGYEPDGVRLLW